ncbi:hypothetical protein PP935_gp008 [Rhizobium phage RHph_N34]|uniref:Uncharacterized protein n=1 Tax=Rhizobium phage RHph_N34 TaxID=2509586 RepID=A0A7S5RA59_9CAUD|nr:hypothetical protein PP935_gp008 [Rhizobium phage RHph_N34]QIG73783.1 hypothetical protein EVC06_008 [Rhizobium phage RHph_N34]
MLSLVVMHVSEVPFFNNYSKEEIKKPWILGIVHVDGLRLIEFLDQPDKKYTISFETREEALEYAKKYEFPENLVFAVLKNADFTEGRGPMLLDKIFKDYIDADEYVMGQIGIYGSKQYRNPYAGINIDGEAYAGMHLNGYEIVFVELQ